MDVLHPFGCRALCTMTDQRAWQTAEVLLHAFVDSSIVRGCVLYVGAGLPRLFFEEISEAALFDFYHPLGSAL